MYEHTCNAAIIVKCIINSLVKTDLNQEEDPNRLVNYLSFNNSYSQTTMYSQKRELTFSMHTSLHFLPTNVLLTPTGKPYKQAFSSMYKHKLQLYTLEIPLRNCVHT